MIAPELRLDAHEGTVWCALVLPPEAASAARAAAVGEQEDGPVGPHITLVHLGKSGDWTYGQLRAAREILEELVASRSPMQFKFAGAGHFEPSPQSDGRIPVYLVPSSPGLNEFRADLVSSLRDAGMVSKSPHGFVPHVCVGYLPAGSPIQLPPVPSDTWAQASASLLVNPKQWEFRFARRTDQEKPVLATEIVRGMPDPPAAPDAGVAKMPKKTDIVSKQGKNWVLKSHEGKVLGEHGSEAEARAQESAINIAKARAAGHNIAKPEDADEFQEFLQNVGDPDTAESGVPERRGNKWVWLKSGEVAGEYDLGEGLHRSTSFANPQLGEASTETGSRGAQVGTEPDVAEPTGISPSMFSKKNDCLRYDVGTLEKPVKMKNGWLKADAFLTRTGVFKYRNVDGSERREYRPPSEVFHPDTLASFELVPVTDDHPPEFLNDSNTSKWQKGNMGENIVQDGHLVRGCMLVSDGGLRDEMLGGKKVQVSCGYTCDLDDTSGVTDDGEKYDCIQRNIRGNHVAIVPVGRAGPEAHVRMDSAAWAMVSIKNEDGGDTRASASEGTHLKMIKIGGKEFKAGSAEAERALGAELQKLDSVKEGLEKMSAERVDSAEYMKKLDEVKKLHDTARRLHDAAYTAHTAAKGAHDDASAAMAEEYEEHKKLLEEQQHKTDSLQKERDELQKKLDAAPKQIEERIKARAALEGQARQVLGRKKFDALSDKEIKLQVLAKTDPDLDVKKLDDAHLDARFDVAMEEFQVEDSQREDGVLTDTEGEEFEPGDPRRYDGMTPEWANKAHTDKDEAQAAMEFRHRNAWKEPITVEPREMHR